MSLFYIIMIKSLILTDVSLNREREKASLQNRRNFPAFFGRVKVSAKQARSTKRETRLALLARFELAFALLKNAEVSFRVNLNLQVQISKKKFSTLMSYISLRN